MIIEKRAPRRVEKLFRPARCHVFYLYVFCGMLAGVEKRRAVVVLDVSPYRDMHGPRQGFGLPCIQADTAVQERAGKQAVYDGLFRRACLARSLGCCVVEHAPFSAVEP